MTLIQEKENKLITVEELFNMELEEGYFYELLNGHIVKKQAPTTYRTDRIAKMKTHCQFGVSEYWIVDPIYKAVEVYSLENNAYTMTSNAIETGEVVSKVLEDFKVDVEKVFA